MKLAPRELLRRMFDAAINAAQPAACLAPDSLARAWAKGIKPKESLDANDGHGFFEALGDSVVTGPTLTNGNDFRAVLITEEAGKTTPASLARQEKIESFAAMGAPRACGRAVAVLLRSS